MSERTGELRIIPRVRNFYLRRQSEEEEAKKEERKQRKKEEAKKERGSREAKKQRRGSKIKKEEAEMDVDRNLIRRFLILNKYSVIAKQCSVAKAFHFSFFCLWTLTPESRSHALPSTNMHSHAITNTQFHLHI